jgi:hypothetical protein
MARRRNRCRNYFDPRGVFFLLAGEPGQCASGLEGAAGDTALPNDGLKRSDSDFRMIRNGHSYGPSLGPSLHDDVTSALLDDSEAMLFENRTDLLAREDTELTHAPLQSE